MEERLGVWFDKEGDYLEITIGKSRKGYFRPIDGSDSYERIDSKTGQIIGFAIFNISKAFKTPSEKEIKLPMRIELKPIGK